MVDKKTICHVTPTKIRKAFFTGKLDELLDEIQSKDSISADEVKELEAFLDLLAAEKKEAREKLGKKYKVVADDDITPPTVDELVDEVNPEKLEAWRKKVEENTKRVRDIISAVSTAARKSAVNIEILKDLVLEIHGLQHYIDQDRVYKDQLYRERLTKIIDEYGVSRKEAEERAKLTKEYRDYKLAVLSTENVNEFIMSAKKKMGNSY